MFLCCSRAVALVSRYDNANGTGILLPGNWIATVYHVLDQATFDDPRTRIRFNVQREVTGSQPEPREFEIDQKQTLDRKSTRLNSSHRH